MEALKKVATKILIEAIQRAEVVTAEIYEKCLNSSKVSERSILATIREQRSVNEEVLLTTVGLLYEVMILRDENNITVDIPLTTKLGLEDCVKNKTFVVKDKESGAIYLAMYDVSDHNVYSACCDKMSVTKNVCILPTQVIHSLIKSDIQPAILSIRSRKLAGDDDLKDNDALRLGATDNLSDIGKIFNDMITAAIENRASDVHITFNGGKADVRFRVDGVVSSYSKLEAHTMESIFNYIINNAKIPAPTKPSEPRQGKISVELADRLVDIRINIISTVRTLNGKPVQDINLRLLDNKSNTLEELGLSPQHREQFKNLFAMSKGIILIVGPTGSGKSTTLYAGIKDCDYQTRNVFTVEDPVEQKMEGILQVDVNEASGAPYSAVIKSFLRHDPDVIIVGEIRDLEVAKIALEASDTGHLVFSTLHTNDAVASIPRFIDMGVTRLSISNSVAAILGQRLVRRICPHCDIEYTLPLEHEWRKMYSLGDKEITLKKGEGCSQCNNTGYMGRLAIAEMFIVTSPIRDAIETGKTLTEIRNMAEKCGYEPMIQDGIKKALDGLTTFDELFKYYSDIV